jgi:hypothetical protein
MVHNRPSVRGKENELGMGMENHKPPQESPSVNKETPDNSRRSLLKAASVGDTGIGDHKGTEETAPANPRQRASRPRRKF